MTGRCMTMLLLSAAVSSAQTVLHPDVAGIRVNGSLLAGVPVATADAPVWVSIDVAGRSVRDLRVDALHHDRDWRPTGSEFINDPFYRRGRKELPSSPAAAGIRSYGRTYTVSLPAGGATEAFRASGNYVVRIVDAGSETAMAEFRMHLAERRSPGMVRLSRRRLPMKIAPWNEAHEVSVTVSDDSFAGDPTDPVPLMQVRRVDIYKNREWTSPVAVDLDRLTETEWVEGLGTSEVRFVAGGISPGNEYRSLDTRNAEHHPPGHVHASRSGTDVSRFFGRGTPDRDGRSVIVSDPLLAEYEEYEFTLWWEADDRRRPIAVVGDFNGWTAGADWTLADTQGDGRYRLRRPLKRGAYDYQYLVGGDAVTLEGNSWETTNVYTALVYYHDYRLGGHDRILAVAQVRGSGPRPAAGKERTNVRD